MTESTRLEERVVRAAEAAVAAQGYVTLVEVLIRLGWLAHSHVDLWRQGRIECLEQMMQTGPGKRSTAIRTLRTWATARGLAPEDTTAVARTRDRHQLRFSVSGDPDTERIWRTRWISADLSPRKAERLRATANASPDLVVVAPLNEWTCGGCAATSSDLLLMQDDAPHCLRCVRLDHLVFLPAGDATRTRRAHKASTLTAVVVRFSRTRKRYQRQGLLVEPEALDAEPPQAR